MPTISVIVPVYKVEKYIHRCVDSILAQIFTDFELILVDDGSPDNCGAICDEYAAKDSRVVVIHQENGGLSAARNAGLNRAHGEYIAFVDSDDWIEKNMLNDMLLAIQKEHAELALCDIDTYYDECYEGVRYPNGESIGNSVLTQEELLDALMTDKWEYVVAWNKLYHRDVFSDLRYIEGIIHEDQAIIHRIYGRVKKAVTIGQRFYHYRQNNAGITRAKISIRKTDLLTGYADRTEYSYENKWISLWEKSANAYIFWFFELYFKFPETRENAKYFDRMKKSLKRVLPYILRCKKVKLRHKVYLTVIYINPQIYMLLKQLLKHR